MKKALILGLMVMLAGCFEDADIRFRPDRIEVKVNSDSNGMLDIWAGPWLSLEQNLTANPNLGMGRLVYFDVEGITPPECTSEMNCYRLSFKPDPVERVTPDLHELVKIKLFLQYWAYGSRDRYGNPQEPTHPKTEEWMAADFARVGYDVELTPREDLGTSMGMSGFGYQYPGSEPVSQRWGEAESNKKIGLLTVWQISNLVRFHSTRDMRDQCPTVDPIVWAIKGDCY